MTTVTATATVAIESIDQFWPDARPLLQAHWMEIAQYQDIPLVVDVERYRQAERDGTLLILSVRDDQRRLVGYCLFFVMPHPHYKTSVHAFEDVIYIDPSVRGFMLARQLLKESHRILRERGVQVVTHHVKLAHPALGRLLSRDGYTAAETLYTKRLD